MPEPSDKQLAALNALKEIDPHLSLEWDEDTGTPATVRGLLSSPAPPVGAQSMGDAAQQAAYAFLRQNRDLYRFVDPEESFPLRRVQSDELGSTVHLYQMYQGVAVYDGELTVALDPQNRVRQVLGRFRPELRHSTEPKVSAERAIEIARTDLNAEDMSLEPISQRLLVLNTGSLPAAAAELGKEDRLVWWIELRVWVYFVDAHEGSIIFTYDNTQDARDRETYYSFNCRLLPGELWIAESGAVPGQPVDDIAWSAHNHAGKFYDYYWETLGRDGIDGQGRTMVSTVHSGVDTIFTCSQNNAAFIPSMVQVVYGDGDGERFGPFAHALDVVAHEWQHAVTYFSVTWPDGRPRGLDYRDESGALNEAYSDFFGVVVENKADWLLGEDCYTPNVPGDAVRDMEDPTKFGQPDHYADYINDGTESYKVHMNSGIMNKCAYLMSDGGTHHDVAVYGMGRENAARIWFRALTHHLQATSGFVDARPAMLQACQELFPGDTVKHVTVQNAFAAVGIGEPAPPPRIATEPKSLDFGTIVVGQSSEQTLTVRNTGSMDLSVTGVHASDPAFAVLGDTAFDLAPDASKELTVQFSPTSVGQQQASLTIESNDASQPTLAVPLSGTALGVAQIAVEPASIGFGTVTLGQSSEQILTVRNAGTADLSVTGVQSSDPAFSVSGDTAFDLAPDASKELTVQFSPASAGEQQAALTIESNDASQPTLTIPLSGTGLGVAQIAVEPTSIGFGTVTLGQSGEAALTVRNTGTGDLSVTGVQSSDPAFSVSDDTAFDLAPDASRELTVQFSPTSVGEQQATLTIESNDASQPTLAVPLSGTGLGVPQIAVEPTSIDFGTVVLGQAAERTLTVQNAGTGDLSVTAVRTGDPAFSVIGDTAFEVAPGASQAITVRFLPTSVGQRQVNLTIESNDSGQPTVTVVLSAQAVGVSSIVVDPTSMDFGAVVLGQPAEQLLTVRNTGSADLTVSSMQSSDAAFSILGRTTFELAPGASQAVGVRFSPTSTGQKEAHLTIQSSDTNRPTVTVPLIGAGVTPPQLVAAPRTLDFASIVIGDNSDLPLSISNVGGSPLQVTQMSIDQPVFSVVGDTAFQIGPGTAKTVVIRFAPAVAGDVQATLSIASNDPQSPSYAVALLGTGEPPPFEGPHIVLEPQQLNYGAVPVGQIKRLNVTVQNRGTATLSVDDVRADSEAYFVYGKKAFTVEPSASQVVAAMYKPPSEGAHGGRLTFFNNDPQHPQASIVVFGTGTRCFVATATHGSPMERDVRTLRTFRDQSLLSSSVGRGMVSLYYRWNDSATDLVAHSQAGRSVARLLLRPFVALARRVTRPKR